MRDKLTIDFNRLNLGVNVSQFTAQRYEEEMVTLVRDMALFVETGAELRLKCAQQVVEWARGSVMGWRHDKETIEANAPTILGKTVQQVVDEARDTAETFRKLDDLVRRRVPYRDWPDEIKSLAEAQPFSELEDDDVLVGVVES